MQQNTLIVRQLGSQPYQRVDLAMHNFTNSRNEQTSDEVWLVQHPPVYTQGQAGKAEHLLCSTNIPIVQSDRGGQITYHGPGQQILYTMVDLRRKKITVRQFVSFLEQSVINSLKQLHINAHVMEKAPGVYVDNKKICSLGLRIRQGCTFHGLALNVAMDLAPFDNINPCGYAGLKMTDVKAYVADITLDKMQKILLENFIYLLNYPRVEFNNWSAQDYD